MSSLKPSEKEGSSLPCPAPPSLEITIWTEAWSFVQRCGEEGTEEEDRWRWRRGKEEGEEAAARGHRVKIPTMLELEGGPQILPQEVEAQRGQATC